MRPGEAKAFERKKAHDDDGSHARPHRHRDAVHHGRHAEDHPEKMPEGDQEEMAPTTISYRFSLITASTARQYAANHT